MSNTITNQLYKIKEFWANKGFPAVMFDQAGEFCTMLENRTVTTWQGRGQAKLAATSKLQGNVGPNYPKVFSNTNANSSGVQFEPFAKEHWNNMRIEERLLEFGTSAYNVGGTSSLDYLAKMTLVGWTKSKSHLLWTDGTGRISKGDGAFSVAGTTITFLNSVSAWQFEVDDKLTFIAEGAAIPASGMPTPRAFAAAPNDSLIVTAIDRENGTMEVDTVITTAIPGALNTDWISKDVYFGDEFGLIDGIFRWLPRTRGSALLDWAGVVRSNDITRLSGQRVLIDSGASPYQIIGKMGRALKLARGGGSIKRDENYCIFVSAGEIEPLTAEASSQSITFTPVNTPDDATKLIMGVSAVRAAWPGLGNVTIIPDAHFHDPALATEEDRGYLLCNMNQIRYLMSGSGVGWKNHGDSASNYLEKIAGTKDYYAALGAYGNLFVEQQSYHVTASPRAADASATSLG